MYTYALEILQSPRPGKLNNETNLLVVGLRLCSLVRVWYQSYSAGGVLPERGNHQCRRVMFISHLLYCMARYVNKMADTRPVCV